MARRASGRPNCRSAQDGACRRSRGPLAPRARARQEKGHRSPLRRRRRSTASDLRSWEPPLEPFRLLILGGTSEASALARRLADKPGIAATLSLAGATARPDPAPIPQRIGGFGGPEGLAAYLEAEQIQAVIDATHPFAAQMSANALKACRVVGAPLVVFSRRPWSPLPGDRWTEVASMDEAVEALGAARRMVFLTQGRLNLAAFARAPQHRYVVRAIDPPLDIQALPEHRLILARGPFSLQSEIALMRDEGIEILVAKNSGGEATYPKIEAARRLGVLVVLLRRPKPPEAETLFDLDAVLEWIAARRGEHANAL